MARLVCQSHVEDRWCVCTPCSSDRLKGCKNPHACALLVKTRLDRLLSKWDPRRPDPPVVTPAPPGEEGARLFVPPPEIATLTDEFRIFTKPTAAPTDAPPATPPAPLPATVSPVQVAIGSHYKLLGTVDAGAAFGVHFGQDDPRNVSSVIPEQKSLTRGCAEAIATLVAARSTPVNAPLRIMSKNVAVASAMNSHLGKWEDNGWIGVPNPEPLIALAAELRARTSPTILVPSSNSPTLPSCRDASVAAVQALATAKNTNTSLSNTHESLRGAKLSMLTQALAYQGIRARKGVPTRPTTDTNVAYIQNFLKDHSGHAPIPEKIWKSIRHTDITSTIKSWLWKSAHGAHRIGSYWKHIPGFEDRALCSHCGSTESLQHILFECSRPGQAIVWRLASEFWAGKLGSPLPTPSLGMVLGSALTSFEEETKSKPSGANRLYRILITESAYLIWKLRNESVIQNGGAVPPAIAVHNRWVSLMNERLKIDIFLATTRSDQNKILVPPEVVLQTWGRTLLNETSLPKDWLRDPRVLVGIETISSNTAGPPSRRRGRHS
ncbi:hypothetical protein DFH07DRAFT_957968 [Mycena maculata]|uniref:Reverse transcriptase zinc-binding domain-containing protein n=1 Tax=Mycena maculata TaxID=230809 RepID=A0AAD7J8K5_9AGAR|nr:hypothetical protein DFH07DRAFT_957968 [Mycena maculata]